MLCLFWLSAQVIEAYWKGELRHKFKAIFFPIGCRQRKTSSTFEIRVRDLEKAKEFYGNLLD